MLHRAWGRTALQIDRQLFLDFSCAAALNKCTTVIEDMNPLRGACNQCELPSTSGGRSCFDAYSNRSLCVSSHCFQPLSSISSGFLTATCGSVISQPQLHRQQSRQMQHRACYSASAQIGKPYNRSSRSHRSEPRSNLNQRHSGKDFSRRSESAGTTSGRRQPGRPEKPQRQEDDSYELDAAPKWQLFPPGQSIQRPRLERRSPVEFRQRQPSPLPFPRLPDEEDLYSSPHDDPPEAFDLIDKSQQQRLYRERREQRSTQGKAAFAPLKTVGSPDPASASSDHIRESSIASADEQFFEPGSSFQALGLHPEVVAALAKSGLPRPSRIQAQAIPVVMEGSDVVIAAETGCGKTLSYLAPVISQLLQQREDFPSSPGNTTADRWRELAIVLLPNAALCKQALAVADSLRGPDGRPLVATYHLSSSSPPRPHQQLDIVVVTSGALQQLLHGGWLGNQWSREGLPKRLKWLIVDEADLLLSGGFATATEQLLEMLRLDERVVRRRQAAWQLGLPADCWDTMPYQLRQAASKGGVKAALAQGHPSVTGTTRPLLPCHPGVSAPGDGDDVADDQRHKTDWRRQYAFVGATIPGEGRKSVAEGLRTKFPQAVWLSGGGLHQPQATLHFDWRLVDDATWLSSLQEAVIGGHLGAAAANQEGCGRTLVFARDVAAAKEVAQCLTAGGAKVLTYHKGVSATDRDAALDLLASNAGVVVVATDSAARGLDIPGVAHVVQADFAASAVDFLHRVGRTGRAGRPGRITSLYTEQAAPLALTLRDAIEAGEPVEGAFSRNRSFGKKFKKYGQYIPRGQRGPSSQERNGSLD